MEYTFETPSAIDLHVRLMHCDVTVRAGETEETVVRIDPLPDSGDADELIARVRVTHDGNRVRVDDTRNKRFFWKSQREYEVTIDVPNNSTCGIHLGSGRAETHGQLGDTEVKAGSGDIIVDAVAAAEMKAGAGNITIGSCTEHSVAAGSGSIDIGRATAGGTIKSGTGNVTIRSAEGGNFRIKTGTGNITFGIPEHVAAKLDIVTGVGSVTNNLERSDARPEADTFIELEVKSGTGNVVLERAAVPATV
jgi:DUF4097 and DUF4098 domain-containing protein YvlB